MLGAIIGDIIGSQYENNPIKTKDFELFPEGCGCTDDSVMTMATAQAIINGTSYQEEMVKYGRLYPDAGYGKMFKQWFLNDVQEPYDSWGNGSAMRISPIGWAFESGHDVLYQAAINSECTHSHPMAVMGAEAVAMAIYIARTPGTSKKNIKGWLNQHFNGEVSLDRTVDEIRPTYSFHVSARLSVPESIICFLDSTSFEDAIRNAVSLGGDADTMAAIAGGIAEAYYGIPEDIYDTALQYIPDTLLQTAKDFHTTIQKSKDLE